MDEPRTEAGLECRREDALAVLQRLREAGHEAYFAGGCVRDLLLGLEPQDWDVATDAPPQRVRSLFPRTQAVGAAFGVILVRHGRSVVEVATFRADLDYADGRRPAGVRFTTAQEDARRRDFTINGLLLDPLRSGPIEQQVIDHVGGVEDLRARRLRAIGDPAERFSEDHLRMLRAVRFAARFGLEIDPTTRAAIIQNAPQLRRISPERIAEELRLMLTPPTRVAAWRSLWDLKLLPVILRLLPEHANSPAGSASALFPRVAAGEPISFGLALAALALCYRLSADDAPPFLALLSRDEVRATVRACRTALRISNEEEQAIEGSLDLLGLLQDEAPRVATMKRFLARPAAEDAQRLLDALGQAGQLPERISWLGAQFEQFKRGDVAPPPLITGDDLVAAGLVPGPAFKRILDAAYGEQLEDRITTRDQALQFALTLSRQA